MASQEDVSEQVGFKGTEKCGTSDQHDFTEFQASTVVASEATVEPEDPSRNEILPSEEDEESRSPTPSPGNKPSGERKRSSWSDSDDNISSLNESCSLASDDDDDFAYNELVESISNLILKSSCVDNPEDRNIPVELYIHNFLEQIMNHPRPSPECQTLCLPIRSLPIQNNESHGDACESDMHIQDQGSNKDSTGRRKRKSDGAPGDSRKRSGKDEDDPGDIQEEKHSKDQQRIKKQKMGRKDVNLSCPFRKRNPNRFNVRGHGNCALSSFGDFALLKPVGQDDPEDGITQDTLRALTARGNEDKIDSWASLWNLLFPDDNLNAIPSPDHEPPVELDEVQEHCYSEEALYDFVENHTVNNDIGSTEGHGFRYIVETFRHCRSEQSHDHSEKRLERDRRFLNTVRDRFNTSQCQYGAQQRPSAFVYHVSETLPDEWMPNENDPMFGDNLDANDGHFQFTSSSSYDPSPFGIHASQDSAPGVLPSSEIPTQQAAPQPAPAKYPAPYTTMLSQNGRPCSPGESLNPSSGPSSQSRDSGYQTQEHDAALHSDGRLSGSGDGNFSTPPGCMPCHHSPPEQSSEFNLCGVGSSTFMGAESPEGSNSDGGLGPLTNMY
ncbi:hypothetical protein J7T55_000036 [Diaporthe amygdali]|uniref:uncharacterized protein n=1 Tax=Phomopsis amygdali TaxID=1214568 RepID=UPI0022FE862B|nr:uncharacterized protein J7T55_000036 [Diaporthe amygdali]KAJ0107774.1 hypothetical protein J7T55_000036 [Diaporthe amygdali]